MKLKLIYIFTLWFILPSIIYSKNISLDTIQSIEEIDVNRDNIADGILINKKENLILYYTNYFDENKVRGLSTELEGQTYYYLIPPKTNLGRYSINTKPDGKGKKILIWSEYYIKRQLPKTDYSIAVSSGSLINFGKLSNILSMGIFLNLEFEKGLDNIFKISRKLWIPGISSNLLFSNFKYQEGYTKFSIFTFGPIFYLPLIDNHKGQFEINIQTGIAYFYKIQYYNKVKKNNYDISSLIELKYLYPINNIKAFINIGNVIIYDTKTNLISLKLNIGAKYVL